MVGGESRLILKYIGEPGSGQQKYLHVNRKDEGKNVSLVTNEDEATWFRIAAEANAA
ncbi:hypothetical protein HK102_006826, partial [Quaeritorhiza haematococci]